jgi:hypothetical protein
MRRFAGIVLGLCALPVGPAAGIMLAAGVNLHAFHPVYFIWTAIAAVLALSLGRASLLARIVAAPTSRSTCGRECRRPIRRSCPPTSVRRPPARSMPQPGSELQRRRSSHATPAAKIPCR